MLFRSLHLVAGINLPFILQFLTSPNQDVSKLIDDSINASKEGIINFDNVNTETTSNEVDEFDSF